MIFGEPIDLSDIGRERAGDKESAGGGIRTLQTAFLTLQAKALAVGRVKRTDRESGEYGRASVTLYPARYQPLSPPGIAPRRRRTEWGGLWRFHSEIGVPAVVRRSRRTAQARVTWRRSIAGFFTAAELGFVPAPDS